MFYLLYIIYIYYIIKLSILIKLSDSLDVYNSPYDRLASYTARLLMCTKGFCETLAPFGFIYGGMVGYDNLRIMRGREPLFLPYIYQK